MKLFESTKIKVIMHKNGEYVPHLEIIDVVLVHHNILTTIISKVHETCIHLFLIKQLVSY